MKHTETWLETLKENEELKYVSLGSFPEEIVNFVVEKKPEFKGRMSDEKEILFWRSRVKHTERHRKDFDSDEEFERCMIEIPKIIQNPDYISIHPTDESVSFIRKYSKNVSVAVKISTDGRQVYRTMYPLRESQLQNYIASGRAWSWKNAVDNEDEV